MDEKKCTKCGLTKSAADFHKHNRKPDGLQCWCKQCKLEAARNQATDDRQRRAALAKQLGLGRLTPTQQWLRIAQYAATGMGAYTINQVNSTE